MRSRNSEGLDSDLSNVSTSLSSYRFIYVINGCTYACGLSRLLSFKGFHALEVLSGNESLEHNCSSKCASQCASATWKD